MNNSSPPTDSRTALRRLTAPHALAFGSRLLDRGHDQAEHAGAITFREFLSVARELVAQVPDQSAVYLAALVALDMSNEDNVIAEPPQPSPN